MEEDACECGEKSTRGCHGIRNNEIYSEYYCDSCYNRKNSKKEVKDESDNVV